MSRSLSVEVVTPAATIFQGEAEMVVAMTTDGEVGILPLHVPIVAELAPGELRLKQGTVEDTQVFATYGGYLQCADDHMIILTDNAINAKAIDVAALEAEKASLEERIKALPADAFDERAELEHELVWTSNCVKVGKKNTK